MGRLTVRSRLDKMEASGEAEAALLSIFARAARTNSPRNNRTDGARPGRFNMLNAPNSDFAANPDKFWELYNEPWVRAAVQRKDIIILATKPTPDVLSVDGKLTGLPLNGFR